MKPTVGRIVHYVTPGEREPLAGIITQVWSETLVNLTAFKPDGTLYDARNVQQFSSYDEHGIERPTWRWPPR